MPAVAVDTAEALKDMLADASLSQDFVCERSYADWELALDSSDDSALRVDVCIVTTKQEVELLTRGGSLAYTVPVDVAIRKRLGREYQDDDTGRIAVEEVDALMLFVQELHEFMVQKRLDGHEAAIWEDDPKIVVAPLVKHLRDNRQFTGIIRLSFRVTP